LPQYRQSVDFMMSLPEMIDKWAAEENKRTRVGGDEISDAFSQAANQRAGRGIMGGTEDDNLRALLLGQVRDRVMEKRAQTARDALLAKVSVGPAITQEMRSSAALLSNMFQTSADDNIRVANLIAQIIQAGYTG